ncbi:hypothetical protein LCGC14_1455560 [marine sediment metagenome]|uniref:HNH nuclease domain-containing protein n=1 Tax=marine sediment metagenome TaxID=412755 RepID=A0A0F9JHC0_9ZZZZ
MIDYCREKGYYEKYSKEMMDFLEDDGYFDKNYEEINKFLIENQSEMKELDWTIIIYRYLKGLEFQEKFYELGKYTRYLECFIQHLKNMNKKKGYKKLPKKFYNSFDWANVRILILNRDKFKCIHCGSLANHVDHINSAKYFPEMSLDPTNLISSCEDCHRKRHKRGFEDKR